MATAANVLTNAPYVRPFRHIVNVYLKEVKYEFLKNLRIPMYSVSTMGFPVMFYVLFGLVLNRGAALDHTTAPAYFIASYGTFGVMGASLTAQRQDS